MSQPKTHILVGRTITAVYLAEDETAIKFTTDAGEIVAKCRAECCSHTWVEHIDLPALGLPAVVVSAEEVELHAELDTRGGELEFYGFKILTDRGELLIDYRNESNGYYGGSLVWPGDHFYGGVRGQNVSAGDWQQVVA
jgi:hypothetical protein